MDWRPSASIENLRRRGEVLRRIREFFHQRAVLEVDTPALSTAAATDLHLRSFATHYHGPAHPAGTTLYLHTSPEFPMKRLLASGSGSIYQLAKVFRDGEAGRLHNPEFTLLEWYRLDWDHRALMAEVAELVTEALQGFVALGPPQHLSYRDAFRQYTGLDPHTADGAQLAACAASHGLRAPTTLTVDDTDTWRDLLLTHRVEPHLGRGRPTFLYDYPASQAALARIRPGIPPLAERFELYLEGVELANGFHELAAADEQRRRFVEDLAARRRAGAATPPLDERLLAALEHGLPQCAGVALGVDRLVMLAVGARSLAEVVAFPVDRA